MLSHFRHRADVILVLLLGLHLVLLVIGAVCPLTLGLYCVPLFFLTIFLYLTTYKVISHNFIHNPFFVKDSWNQNFSCLLTLGIGLPQTLIKIYHENHHRFNSDMQDLFHHTTNDWSSLYRYSDIPKQTENFWSYTFKGIFRLDLKKLYFIACEQGQKKQVQKELAVLIIFWLLIIFPHFYSFLFFYFTAWFFGQCAFFAQNYMEHYRAIPGNRLTDSVSCYSRSYNLIWFNNGYHQEHHYKPNVHWTDIKRVRAEMLPINQRMVVKGSHWFNF